MADRAEPRVNQFQRLFMYRRGGFYSFLGFMLLAVDLQTQLVPAWRHWDYGLHPLIIILIITAAGGAAGFFGARLRIGGLASGALLGCGSTLVTWALLHHWPGDQLPNILLASAMVAGCVPGFLLYSALDKRYPAQPATPAWQGYR
jgi:hypothetical protein